MNFLYAFIGTFIGCAILVPLVLGIAKLFGIYTIVTEGRSKVYMLFGKVITVINESGIHFLLGKIGWRAFFVNWLGKCLEESIRPCVRQHVMAPLCGDRLDDFHAVAEGERRRMERETGALVPDGRCEARGERGRERRPDSGGGA